MICSAILYFKFYSSIFSNESLQSHLNWFSDSSSCHSMLMGNHQKHASKSVDAVEAGIVVGSSSTTYFSAAAVIDAYPNNATVEQGSNLILVCRVVGVPSTTVLSYEWTCPGGYCDAGGVDPEWAARIQQGNILVVNVLRQVTDTGFYTCTVLSDTQQVGTAMYALTVASELCIK